MSTAPPERTPPQGFPLTTVERRFFLLHHLHPEAPIANIGRVVELRGPLDVAALRRAFDVIARHPMLRLRVHEERGEPIGVLGPPPTLEIVDGVVTPDVVDRATDEIVKARYDLADHPPFRARLLTLGDNDHVLVLGAHHLILDGWGLSRSLPGALCAALRGEVLSVVDDETFIAHRRAHPDEEPPEADVERDRAWWAERLRGLQPITLPIVSPPPPRASGRAWDVEVPIDKDLFTRAIDFAAAIGARPVHVFLAAFAIELGRAARTRDLVIGTTSASRTTMPDPATAMASPGDRGLGCFVRTRALRVTIDDKASFRDVVTSARAAVRESLEHAAFDAEELHTIGAPPLAALYNYIPFPAFDGEIKGVDIVGGRIIAGGTAFPIALTVDEKGPAPRLVVEVDADIFDEGFAGRFAERVMAVLESAIGAPDLPHGRLPRLGPTDRAALERNAPTPAELAHIVGGHLGRAIAADLKGSRAALVFVADPADPASDVVVERAALYRRASAVARSLRDDGVGPGRFVGVQCEHPLRTVEAIFGVLLAGAAYVPVDPAAPPLRRDAIVAQADLTIVLDDDATMARSAHGSTDGGPGTIAPADVPGRADDPAYAIFTSGSTGTPKGVVISHRAVMSQLQAREALGFPHVERSMLLAPFFFDGSVETLFWSFTTGGTMHVLDEQARRDPIAIRRGLSRRRITYTSAVPALWGAMLDAFPVGIEPLDALGFVIVGGEKLTTQLIEKHRLHTTAWLVNEYGPTESTVFSSAWSAPRRGEAVGERVPIGRSAPHVVCAVVDDDLQPVPALEPGELIVSGPGLAEGYLRAPELTAKAFVMRDRGDGTQERVYRTGDIVRLWPDGELEWLARRDEQVKLRGLRVEPGEVEAAIMAAGADLPGGIKECAVLVDGQHLLAWVSPATVDETLLIAALQQRLPEAMVPARVVAMPVLPKTANDKIDKRALPRVVVEDAVVAPATDTEARVAATWAKVLGVDAVSVTKSFFALGGHSLKAAVAVRAHSDEFGVEVTLSSLMLARTVRELARRIDAQLGRTGHATPMPATTARDRGHLLLPLTSRDGEPDVIFLPGIGGHVFTFAPIAERMAHLGVGLRTFGSEPGEEPLTTVEALAAHNLEVLDEIGVRDDVVFAGYSFGGLVAYEMALQRCAAGRPPRQLVIFDTMAPGYPKKLPALTRARLHVETVWRLDWEGRRSYFRDRVASVKEKFNLRMARADAFADAFASGEEEVAAMSPAQRERIERLAGLSTVAHHRYWPRASIPVPMTLFAAEKDFDWAATKMDDPIKGWRAWVTGPIHRVELSGDHLRLFNPENLDTAARALDRVLADR